MGKGLRKVTQSLALVAGLLRVKPKMIGISQHVFKQQLRSLGRAVPEPDSESGLMTGNISLVSAIKD